MRIVFMGTPDFAVPSLKALMESGHRVVAVVTQPDRPRGRGQRVTPVPVKRVAVKHRLACLQPEDLNAPGFISQLEGLRPDLIVVVAFRILPRAVFEVPPLGTINLHPSLLPRYRGAAPINWAIINGETETGVTTFFIDEGLDSGEVILQRRVAIGGEEAAGQLHDRLAVLGAEVLLETIELIAIGRVPRVVQGEEVSFAPKLQRSHCEIDWSREAVAIKNLIRGLSPLPGAQAEIGGRTVKIYRASVVDETSTLDPPGKVVEVEKRGGIIVTTGKGLLSLLEMQPSGKRKMTGAEFARGYRVGGGEVFGRKGG